MKLRLTALGALIASASALGTSAAIADGYYVSRGHHAVPAELTWTGLYIGGHIGGAWTDAEWANVTLTGERIGNNASGIFGGGQIGYNRQFAHLVFGVEGSLSGTALRDNARSLVSPVTISYGTDINAIATATGRLGVAYDRWLIYAKGGWAGAQVDISGSDSAVAGSFSFDKWRNGWTVGGGLEYKFQADFSLGVEYGFIDLGSETKTGITTLGIPVTVTDHDVQIQSVTARLNYHF
jgi:outer membrane immunogenic protein